VHERWFGGILVGDSFFCTNSGRSEGLWNVSMVLNYNERVDYTGILAARIFSMPLFALTMKKPERERDSRLQSC